jgi:cell division protein FtsI/penicillin-binding protein 2
MSRVCVRSGRYTWCTAVFVAGFLLLCGRLFFLQVVEAEAIAAEVETMRKRLDKVEAKRGDILDRNGNLLAGTRSRVDLGVDPSIVDSIDRGKLALLAGILDLPFEEVEAAFLKKNGSTVPGASRPCAG